MSCGADSPPTARESSGTTARCVSAYEAAGGSFLAEELDRVVSEIEHLASPED